MFAFQNKSDMVRVGERKWEASKKKLKQLGIPLKAEDTGLNSWSYGNFLSRDR